MTDSQHSQHKGQHTPIPTAAKRDVRRLRRRTDEVVCDVVEVEVAVRRTHRSSAHCAGRRGAVPAGFLFFHQPVQVRNGVHRPLQPFPQPRKERHSSRRLHALSPLETPQKSAFSRRSVDATPASSEFLT